jgi:hypothetical protein
MMSIYFLKTFSFSEERIINIDDDTLIRVRVDLPIIAWSVLAPNKLGDHDSHSAHRELLSIEKMVCSSFEMDSNILTLGIILRQLSIHVLVLLIYSKLW